MTYEIKVECDVFNPLDLWLNTPENPQVFPLTTIPKGFYLDKITQSLIKGGGYVIVYTSIVWYFTKPYTSTSFI